MDPKKAAAQAVAAMTHRETDKVRRHGGADYEADGEELFGRNADAIVEFVDEIERLCGYSEET